MMAHQAPYRPVGAAGRKTARVFFENVVLSALYALPTSTVSFHMGRFCKFREVVRLPVRKKNISVKEPETVENACIQGRR